VRDTLDRIAGPVALQREQPVRLAQRLVIIRVRCRVNRPRGALACAPLIAKTAVHVRKPEEVRRCERRVLEPRETYGVGKQHVHALHETAEEIQRVCVQQCDVERPAVALGPFR
jgi:hypothetical protein